MIKSYLQLVRIPGIFTTFTNIFLGFFAVQGTDIAWQSLGPLLIASGFLFLGGMALNDYFDYFKDKKERPERPLPSGRIARKSALYVGLSFLLAANLFSLMISFESVLISLIMSSLIFSYDIKSKKIPVIGLINLSSIRFLNVILGSTVVSFNPEIIKYAIPIAIFVTGISILAKTESSGYSKKTLRINLVFILITIIFVVIVINGQGEFINLIFLVPFLAAVFVPFMMFNEKTSRDVQKKVTFQLLAITILDGVLISSISNPIYGMMAFLMYIPAYLTVRKLYFT